MTMDAGATSPTMARFGLPPRTWPWVEDEPWGFAPFHYGRWAFVESSWCWVPGPVYVRPVYAPALVAFVGGGGFHLAVGVGEGVAWFPLAPGEVYVPPYRVSRVYVNNVNITNTRVNITQVTNVYNNYTVNHTNINRIAYVNHANPSPVTVGTPDPAVALLRTWSLANSPRHPSVTLRQFSPRKRVCSEPELLRASDRRPPSRAAQSSPRAIQLHGALLLNNSAQ